jgi:hypothetical protein
MNRRQVAMSLITLGIFGAGPSLDDEYVFVQDTERYVGVFRGQDFLLGKLNAEGDFIQTARYARDARLSQIPHYTGLNGLREKPIKAYEFRSGRLIKGELGTDGSFIPEAGSTVLLFKDYHYSPDAIPIWNLPGRFEKKK